ncbi:hypothetical protein KSP40_PGU003211 [Platanthera guangdongensis]|uniref:Uncharacterized protein n=1 Tax=Platanthera guangdongensis TaxID=2320717 RepID=A0ABR2LJW7_9ASPA
MVNGLGAHLLCYPGAFNMTTGPLHWELLQRARWSRSDEEDANHAELLFPEGVASKGALPGATRTPTNLDEFHMDLNSSEEVVCNQQSPLGDTGLNPSPIRGR